MSNHCRHACDLDIAPCVDCLGEDNARLKALVCDVEWGNYRNDTSQLPFCPWCDAEERASGRHKPECPAFTVNGEVR